jgi:hypothetical protein
MTKNYINPNNLNETGDILVVGGPIHVATTTRSNIPDPGSGAVLYHDDTLDCPAFAAADGSLQPVALGLVIPATDGDTVSAAKLAAMADNGTIEVGPVSGVFTAGSARHTSLTIPIGASQKVSLRALCKGTTATEKCECMIVGTWSRTGSASAVQDVLLHGAPYLLNDPDWDPQVELSGNTLLCRSSADAINGTKISWTLWLEVEDTSGVPAASVDPLGTLKARVQIVGGVVLQSDAGVHVDATKAGYCDTWTDQANGWTFTATADAQDPQISTLADEVTPALINTLATGFVQDGTTPIQAVGGDCSAHFVIEPTSITDSMAWLLGTDIGQGWCQTAWGGGGVNGGEPGVLVNGSDYLVSSHAQTSALQILSFIVDGTAETVSIYRDGQLLDSFELTQSMGFTRPLLLLKYSNNSNGALARVAAVVLINSCAASDTTLTLAALRAKYPELP